MTNSIYVRYSKLLLSHVLSGKQTKGKQKRAAVTTKTGLQILNKFL